MSDLKSLGYVKIQATDMERWRHFAFGVLGFAEGSVPEDSEGDLFVHLRCPVCGKEKLLVQSP